jgi:hypothetical protein
MCAISAQTQQDVTTEWKQAETAPGQPLGASMNATALVCAIALSTLSVGSATAGPPEGTRWLTWKPFAQTPDCELKLVDVFHRAPDQAIYFKIKNLSKNRVTYHFGMTVLRAGKPLASPTVFAENVNPGETRDTQTQPVRGSLAGSTIIPRVESCVVTRPK